MKIAIDIRSIGQQRTGDEVYTLNLVQNLIKIDSDNFYFLLTNTRKEKQLQSILAKIFGEDKNLPERVKIISITPASKFLWTFFLLPIWVMKNKIDILHVQYITPLFLSKKTKIITTVHDVSFDAYPDFIKKSDFFFLKTLIPLSLKKADKIIAISNFTKSEIIKYHQISKDKIKIIYNGGASEVFLGEITDREIEEVNSRYKLNPPFIFHIGTLQPRKNIPFLLKSYQLFQEKYSKDQEEIGNINFYLTGNKDSHNFDEEIKTTLSQIEKETPEIFKKIKFIGYVDAKDLPLILKEARIAVSASLYEGFGLPAIEAMASKTPLISSDNSCLKEIIGDAASFYQQHDKNNLAKKIFEVIINKDLRDEMVQKGIERSGYFNWEKCAQETLDLYKLLKNK